MIYTVTFNPSLDYIVRMDHFEAGAINGMLTQITSGLKAGTKVLTDVTAQQPEEEEQAQQSNPFMPRPGAKKNNKK